MSEALTSPTLTKWLLRISETSPLREGNSPFIIRKKRILSFKDGLW
jgi:hypothetical protein